MQTYDPNQPQQSHDGYYQQQQTQNQQQQQRISLPPASSFFGPPPASSEYHHSNTPHSEPPPSPFLTGHYNQPQSYPSTDPNTPYSMHPSAISPPNYNMGQPSTSHHMSPLGQGMIPNYPPPMHQQQQMYNHPPQQNIESQGLYGGIDQQQHHIHPQQQPQHHQLQMGYPSTSTMMPPQDHHHPMQQQQMGGYMSPMEQMPLNYSQHQSYHPSMLPPSHPPPSQHQHPPHQMIQQIPPFQRHHSQHSEMSNNSILRNHLRQQPPPSMQQTPPTSSTMESSSSIVASSENNMNQVLQMQHQQQSQQQQLSQNQNSSQQERIIAAENQILPSNYIQQPEMDQRGYNNNRSAGYQHQQHSQSHPIFQNPMNERSYPNTSMGPPPIPSQRIYHDQQIVGPQEYHPHQQHQMNLESQPQTPSLMPNNFPSINEPSPMTFPSKNEQQISESKTESSIAATVAEVIAKQSSKLPESASTPSPPPVKKRRNVRTVESESMQSSSEGVGQTVRQHLQAQQNEKRKNEQQEKFLTQLKDDEEKRISNENAMVEVRPLPTPIEQQQPLRGPGMTRTEFLQAHRQRKSGNLERNNDKDTVVRIIEEIAGSSFHDPPLPETSTHESSNQSSTDIQIIEDDSSKLSTQNFDENSETVPTPTNKPQPTKPKRTRKKPPQRETKVQKENKKKFLFKCLHLQRTIRSLILKNSALADETSRLFYRIKTVTEERKMLAKRVQHFERNRIRRIQSQKKKKAKAAAELAQSFLQESQQHQQQEINYPPSVEIYEPEEILPHYRHESVEAIPYDNMIHKEMAVYLPAINEDFSQIPYLDPSQYPLEDFQEPMNLDSQYSNVQYGNNFPSNYEQFSEQEQLIQQELSEEIPSKRQRIGSQQFENIQFLNPDNDSRAFFEHQQRQQILHSETISPTTFHEASNHSK
jgi:hypothetical protein